MPDITDLIHHATGPVRLKARWVLPISAPPIANGEVTYTEGRLTYVGRALPDDGAIDLGNCALLPGFVNVHAHLEYTVLRGLIEDIPFFPWVRTLTALKAYLAHEDWVASATLGAAELAAAGVTTVGDAADAGATVPALIGSGLRGIVFREVFGIEDEPTVAMTISVLKRRLHEMQTTISRSQADHRIRLGISPHAPYTVRPELLAACAQLAQEQGYLQTIHMAESPAEEALFRTQSGPFVEMFERRRIRWQPLADRPIAHVAAAGGLAAPTIAVHCVHATEDDVLTLVRSDARIAHCPRSNGKLGAGWAPLRLFRERGLDIGLGSDSVVSGNAIDFFEEMRAAIYGARAREQDTPILTAREALHMATLGGARVLGWDDEIGTLTPGKRADLCAVRLDAVHFSPVADDNPEAALVYSARASDVALTLVEGRPIYDHGRFPLLDTARLRQSLSQARQKLRTEGEKVLGATQWRK